MGGKTTLVIKKKRKALLYTYGTGSSRITEAMMIFGRVEQYHRIVLAVRNISMIVEPAGEL